MLVSLIKRKRPDNRPQFSYTNPVYDGGIEENQGNELNNQTSFYDAAPTNGTNYYNDIDPQHTIQRAEEQKNRYRLGLDPLPSFMSTATTDI